MILSRLNLVCSRGHRFYAPCPEAWVGQTCTFAYDNELRADGQLRIRVRRCGAPLRRLRGNSPVMERLPAA